MPKRKERAKDFDRGQIIRIEPNVFPFLCLDEQLSFLPLLCFVCSLMAQLHQLKMAPADTQLARRSRSQRPFGRNRHPGARLGEQESVELGEKRRNEVRPPGGAKRTQSRWLSSCWVQKGRDRGDQENVSEYQGYTIKLNPETGRWEVFWKERKQPVDFTREADAEQWIEDLIGVTPVEWTADGLRLTLLSSDSFRS